MKQIKKLDKNFVLKNFHDVLGFDLELDRCMRTVSRVRKNNILIVGEEGVGRTSLAKAFILGQVRVGKDVYELDISSLLISLSSDTGTNDLKSLLSSITSGILFIDNISTVLNFDRKNIFRLSAILLDLAENVKISVVINTTPSEFRLYFEKDTNFNSLYEVINIREPEDSIVFAIIDYKSRDIKNDYGVDFSKDIVPDIITLAKRYIYGGKFMPSKAIDLLDEALVKVSYVKEKELTIEDVKQVISERTGIPVNSITSSDKERLLNLQKRLNESVIGQEIATKKVSDIIKRSRVGVKDPKRPIGSFLFLGTSGVGKTELAKKLAVEVFLDESALIRIDMSEYSEAHNVQRLIGAPPGYVGYEEGGQLTNPVWDRPYSLILLDEIEKAHPRVFDLFLQIIDEGRLTDGQGRTVNFNNTVIIATSNIGVNELVKPEVVSKASDTSFNEKYVIPMLIKYFRPEFINRFDEIVFFKPLTKSDLSRIVNLRLDELSTRLANLGINVKFREETIKYLVENSYNPKFGARPLGRTIREKIENKVAQKILEGTIKEGTELLI